jgi:hypothetical protein
MFCKGDKIKFVLFQNQPVAFVSGDLYRRATFRAYLFDVIAVQITDMITLAVRAISIQSR